MQIVMAMTDGLIFVDFLIGEYLTFIGPHTDSIYPWFKLAAKFPEFGGFNTEGSFLASSSPYPLPYYSLPPHPSFSYPSPPIHSHRLLLKFTPYQVLFPSPILITSRLLHLLSVSSPLIIRTTFISFPSSLTCI